VLDCASSVLAILTGRPHDIPASSASHQFAIVMRFWVGGPVNE
jgi:hypothetical protein